MGRYGASLLPTLYPRAGDRVTGIARPSPVNIALVKVFAHWPAYSVASQEALRGPSRHGRLVRGAAVFPHKVYIC